MIIQNAKIILKNRILTNGYIETKEGIISSIGEGKYFGPDNNVIDAKGNILMPGFIDIHTHGALGIDFMDANIEDIKRISEQFYKEGITTFLLTTLTSSKEALLKVCQTVKEAINIVPSLGGIHLEGPFICSKYKGAQNEEYIRKPTNEEVDELISTSNNNIRLITMAAESENALEVIPHLVEKGVTVSIGHSNATFDEAMKAFSIGASNITHAHNAMSGYHHREPGVVEAAMYNDKIYTELICDRIHVCDNTIKTFYKIVSPERFMIITDSLSAKGSNSDEFELMGLPCIKKNGAAYLKAGPLAGSLLFYNVGVKNIKELTNASFIDLAKISSFNQAKSLKLLDRGEIAVGKIADFVLVDENINVISTFKLGKRVY